MRVRKKLLLTLLTILLVSVSLWLVFIPRPALQGVWRTSGYGMIVRVSPLFIDVYEETNISCIRWLRLPANTWLLATQGIDLSLNDNALKITQLST